MPDIFGGLVREWDELTHPHGPQPAAPASTENENTTTQEEPDMQITAVAADIKTAAENADQWLKEVTETHLPGILAQAAKYEASPIVQALEGVVLPPEVEAGLAATIKGLAAAYPAAQASSAAGDAQAVTAAPQQ